MLELELIRERNDYFIFRNDINRSRASFHTPLRKKPIDLWRKLGFFLCQYFFFQTNIVEKIIIRIVH